MVEYEYCDNCGDKMLMDESIAVEHLKQNIMSANKGESAVLCKECNKILGEIKMVGLMQSIMQNAFDDEDLTLTRDAEQDDYIGYNHYITTL